MTLETAAPTPITSVKVIPTTAKGTVISDEGNPAYLAGALYEYKLFVERTGHYKTLIEQGIVSTHRGIVTDSSEALHLVKKTVKEIKTYTFDEPCPPSAQRIKEYDDAAVLLTSPGYKDATSKLAEIVPDKAGIITSVKTLNCLRISKRQ